MNAEASKPGSAPEGEVVVETDSRSLGSDPVEEVVLETKAAPSSTYAAGEEVALEIDPSSSAGDPELSESEKKEIAKQVIDHIQQHARAHGSFSGFADFLSQCDRIILETRATRGKYAVTLANSLARDVSSIREAADAVAPETRALLYRGITTGFLYANLKREITQGKDGRADRFSRKEYFAAVAKKPKSRALLAKSLGVTLHALASWEKRHRATKTQRG